jgi:hypothetical protein
VIQLRKLRSSLAGVREQEVRTYVSDEELQADRPAMTERGMYLSSSRNRADGTIEAVWKSRARTTVAAKPGAAFYPDRQALDAVKPAMRRAGLYLASVWNEPNGEVRAVWSRQGRR